ncbi:sigma-54 interaction domain-containing protein [Effusibacillus pohliae]|uniref:sigma-54 interaction domain-containing protein n=1 Tax=Effusibacillus pohliae TaxID=232270 RepID=UPI0003A69C27|nr:sigma 54-interacting transcriptional regulator [Effusibacillus pohliae]
MDSQSRKIKAFFDVLLDSVNDAVTGVDRDGTVLYWNNVAERLYGIPKEQIIGKPIGNFFQKGSLMLFQVMETGCPVYQVYHRPRPDKHVFINAVPIYDENGELLGAVAIEQDITHTVKLSEELYNRPDSPIDAPPGRQLVHRSRSMQQILQFLTHTSKQSFSILLTGEAGVGKQTLAALAHRTGNKSGPFIAINCDSIPSGLLDAELFGYQGGTFGGEDERPGKLELAAGGTVYLKNVHALPLPTQSKLSQALGEGHFFRTGGMNPIPLRCQIVASSVPEVEELVAKGVFLQELFYRFHTFAVPALAERKEDLPELCHLFLSKSAQTVGKPVPRLSSEVMAALTTYDWPGNLPQLRNVMEYLAIVADGREVTLEHLPPAIRLTTLSQLAEDALPLSALSEEMERAKIEDALRKTGGNKAGAARLLGISRGALYYKIKQYGL